MKPAKLAKLVLLITVLAGIGLAVFYRDQFQTDLLQAWVEELGAAAPIIFILVYAVGTVFFLPGWILTVTGGAVFGPVWGSLYNLTGATLGATLAFLVSRYLAGDWVSRRLAGRTKKLVQGVEAEGWRFVAFTRLVPLFPFNLLNYALGLTRIPLKQYILASYVFMLPGAVAYTYLGHAGRQAVAGSEETIQQGLLALGLIALVGFLPRLIARLRQGSVLSIDEFKQQLDTEPKPIVLDIRSEQEYRNEGGHIAGSLNIPLDELPQRIEELEPFLEQPIAIVCRTDRRSSKAARVLAGRGFAKLHVVKGGITEWAQRGLPLVKNNP